PVVDFKPNVPQNAAGIRMDPPVSDPSAIGTMPAATAAAEPPLDPPVMRSGAQGFPVRPHAETVLVPPAASSCWLVFPKRIASASRMRAITVESWLRTLSR